MQTIPQYTICTTGFLRKLLNSGLLCSIVLTCCSLQTVQAAPRSTAMTVVYHSHPPLSYEESGLRRGYISEVLDAMLFEVPMEIQPQFMPIVRAFQVLESQKNTLMYPVTRLPEREHLYEWIGPVAPRSINLYKLKTRKDIQISQLSQLGSYRIGLVREMASTKNLMNHPGISKDGLDFAPTPESNFRKFFLGRTDLIVSSEWAAIYMTRSLNRSIRELDLVMVLDQQHQYYIALNRNSDPELVSRLRAAFEKLQKNGIIDQIKQKYTD